LPRFAYGYWLFSARNSTSATVADSYGIREFAMAGGLIPIGRVFLISNGASLDW